MSDHCEDCDRHYFGYGDRVRLVQNHMLTGQVIGERNWHQEYLVRLGATVSAIWFESVELEPDPDFEDDGTAAAGDGGENNVIPFPKKAGGLH
jgi:hypothetical protein